MSKSCRYLLSLFAFTLLASCGGGGGSSDFGAKGDVLVTLPDGTFRPVKSGSPYAQVLVKCLDLPDNGTPCTLGTLPFIGQKTQSPSKDDILARTIVSHSWMATRFGELLDKMPEDIRLLFRGVTGVVIGSDIRPSYYTSTTGAIYLDPEDLWLTQTERKTISDAPDYRSDFGSELKFAWLWRYVKNGDYAWRGGQTTDRTINDITMPMAALLFHELAHANDFMPPALLPNVSSQNTVDQQVDANFNNMTTTNLYNTNPLMSEIMHGLGQVLFQGAKATTQEKTYTAAQVGVEFASDGASDAYAYSSPFEDTAMLFEEVMMKYHYNVDREMAFTDAPLNDGSFCDDYVVRWGQRNRIGDPLVKARAQKVVGQLLGRTDTFVYFAILPTPRFMVNGSDWCSIEVTNNGILRKPQLRPLNPADRLPPHQSRL